MDAHALNAIGKGIANLSTSHKPQATSHIPIGTTMEIFAGGGKPRPGIDKFKVVRYELSVPWGTIGVFRGYQNNFYLIDFGAEYGTVALPRRALKEPEMLPSWIDSWKFEQGYDDGCDAFWNETHKLGLNDPTDSYGLGFVKGYHDALKTPKRAAQDHFSYNPYNEVVRVLEQLGGNNA